MSIDRSGPAATNPLSFSTRLRPPRGAAEAAAITKNAEWKQNTVLRAIMALHGLADSVSRKLTLQGPLWRRTLKIL